MKPLIAWLGALFVAAAAGGCAAPPVATVPTPTGPPAVAQPEDRSVFAAAERLAAEHPAQAVQGYRDFLRRFPASPLAPEAWLRIGLIQRDRGELAAAREAFEGAAAAPRGSPVFRNAVLALLALDHAQGAFDSLFRRAAQLPMASLEPAERAAVLEMLQDGFWALDQPGEAAYAAARAWELAPAERRPVLEEKMRLALGRLEPDRLAALLSRPLGAEARDLLRRLGQDARYDSRRIGCLLPLSGSHAHYGQRAMRGVELALAHFAEHAGGVRIQLRVADTGSLDERAVQAVAELQAEGVAAIIGPMTTAAAAAEAAQALRIPMIVFTQREAITRPGDYIFRHFITPRMQIEALVRWAVERRGLTRFAVLYPRERYGQAFVADFQRCVGNTGAKIVQSLSYDPQQTDFAAEIRQLIIGQAPVQGPDAGRSGLKPPPAAPIVDCDALFIPDAPSKAGLILPQLAYHDVTQPLLMGTNLWHSQTLIDMAGRHAEGAVFTTAFFPEDPAPAVAQFVARFQSVYGETPGFIEAVAFDTGLMLCEILIRPEIHSRAQVRDALRGSVFPQAVSGETGFGADGEAYKRLRLMEIQDGRFVMREILPAAPGGRDGR
jgi:ABC-type branched-subunit amino acid transport system substrate-binding protein